MMRPSCVGAAPPALSLEGMPSSCTGEGHICPIRTSEWSAPPSNVTRRGVKPAALPCLQPLTSFCLLLLHCGGGETREKLIRKCAPGGHAVWRWHHHWQVSCHGYLAALSQCLISYLGATAAMIRPLLSLSIQYSILSIPLFKLYSSHWHRRPRPRNCQHISIIPAQMRQGLAALLGIMYCNLSARHAHKQFSLISKSPRRYLYLHTMHSLQ